MSALQDLLVGLPPERRGWITVTMLVELLGRPDPTILEIGANDGQHTAWFLEAFRRPVVHCFEPEARAVRRFLERYDRTPGIELHEIAISDRDGEANFFRSDGSKGDGTVPELVEGWDHSGSLRAPRRHLEIHPWVKFERVCRVRTRSLDSWADEMEVGGIDLIWMDVQGSEMDVIRGATRVLERSRFLFSEYSNEEIYEGQTNLNQLLQRLTGFDVLVRFESDVLLVNTRLESRRLRDLRRRLRLLAKP